MSATVYIKETFQGDDHRERYREVHVPDANHCQVTTEGYLRLTTSSSWSEQAGLFKEWDHVVIHQRWLRGPNGQFISKEGW